MDDYTPGCHDLPPEISAMSKSINTHDKCVRVYSDVGCSGETRDYAPDGPYQQNDLEEWNDKIKSWEMCPEMITFFPYKEFMGKSLKLAVPYNIL